MPRKSKPTHSRIKTRATDYRTTKDIIIPKGTHVMAVTSMRQHVVHAAMAVIAVGKDAHFDWLMYVEDALREGLIEEVQKGTQDGPDTFADYTDGTT